MQFIYHKETNNFKINYNYPKNKKSKFDMLISISDQIKQITIKKYKTAFIKKSKQKNPTCDLARTD